MLVLCDAVLQKNLTLFRSVMLFGGGLISIFGSKYVKWSGAGPLACLGIAFVAGLRWRKECPPGKKVRRFSLYTTGLVRWRKKQKVRRFGLYITVLVMWR